MANTLTLTEFETKKASALANVYASLVKYLADQKAGCTTCGYGTIHELVLCAKVLDSWEQDKFNSVQLTNYLSSNNIQAIFNRINQLI